MEKLCLLLFGLSVLWVGMTSCFPSPPKVLEYRLSRNRPIRDTGCHGDEYLSQGLCCQNCPAGTYVADHCTENHQRGSCQPCSLGYDFTASPNGLENCQSCRVCRNEQVMVHSCTLSSDTVCECGPGTYCIPGEVCEICMACSRCGDGQRIKEECSATKNVVCEDIPVAQPASNTTRFYLPPTDIKKSVSSTPEKAVTKNINATIEKDITKNHDPKDGNGSYWVHFIIILVLFITALAFIVAFVCWRCRKVREQKQDRTSSRDFLNNSSRHTSADSSLNSTPLIARGHQDLDRPPPEVQQLLKASKAPDHSNRVTEPTEHSSVQGPQNNEDPGPGGDDHGGGGRGGTTQDNEPCSHCGQSRPCDCDWPKCFYCIIDHVPSEYIVRLVRVLRVPNTNIDCITQDHRHNTSEQYYQLLERWRILMGKQVSMESVLGALREMELGGCVENIINSLKIKNIPIS